MVKPFTPKFNKVHFPNLLKRNTWVRKWELVIVSIIIYYLEWAIKNRVLHTVWCNISGEAAGEIQQWSLLGARGLNYDDINPLNGYCIVSSYYAWESWGPHSHCEWVSGHYFCSLSFVFRLQRLIPVVLKLCASQQICILIKEVPLPYTQTLTGPSSTVPTGSSIPYTSQAWTNNRPTQRPKFASLCFCVLPRVCFCW